MINFNADEVFEMAEQIEHNGGRFYRAAAESAGDDMKPLLIKLAEMEDEHERTFADMRTQLAVVETRTLTFDPDDQAVQYIQAMVDGKVFAGDPCELLSPAKDIALVLEIAISIEKDSIIFYQCMKPFVPAEFGKDRINDIISQEIGHILILTKHLQAAQG